MPWRILIGLTIGLLSQTEALQEWASKKSQGRRLAELSGIYESIVGKGPKELLVHDSDRDDSEFLPRDVQKKLIQNIEDRTPTLIVGPSMSGKTRLVMETVCKNYPSMPVWIPKKGEDIRNVYDNNLLKRGSIIIFDNIDEFLSDQTLSFGQLDEWIRGSCIIIATMMKSSYMPWRDGVKNKLPGWGIINRFTVLQIKALLTDNERTALLNSSYADLAATVEKVGLAPLLGGAPAVRQRLEEGREQHLWGYALVRAAADWRRAGLGSATKRQIQEVALALKDDIAWDEPDWEEAWTWASKKLHDIVSPIHQTGPHAWEALDLVADEADWPLNQQTLEAMAGAEHSPRQAFAIFWTMYTDLTLDNENPVVKQILQETDEFLYKFTTKPAPDSNSFGFYALFLKTIRRDYDRAEAMYERAIKADPNHANNLGNYANFLETIRRDYDRAEAMYERAIKADPNHANNLSVYAVFLETIRRDYDRAEAMYERAQNMYERAIKADPNHADILGVYAVFLETIRRDYDRAEAMYERAIKADPNHANNLGNYADFLELETVRRDYDRAEAMYERAIKADPNHANNLGNYANFLKNVRHDYDRAQDMFERAINADPSDANILGNYALFLTDILHDSSRTEEMFERAIKADPNHANNLGNYSQILFATGRDETATTLATRTLSLAGPDEKPLVAECRFYLFAHSPRHRRKSGERLRDLLAAGVTTGSWSFEPNLERLRREKDPRHDLVRDVADALRSGDTRTLEARGEWYAL